MDREPSTPVSIGLLRLFWIFFGPAILFILAFGMTSQPAGWFGLASLAYLVILGAVIVARQFDPRDSLGDPASPGDVQRFTILALIAGLAVWVVANGLGNHWLVS